jgi:hypothetical protein
MRRPGTGQPQEGRMGSRHLIAVDNTGDNWHNQLLQLSIFMTARVASHTLRLIELVQKPAIPEQCRERDTYRQDGIDDGRAVVFVVI